MRFSLVSLCLAVGLASAQTADFLSITKPLKDEKIAGGSQYEVTWTPNQKYAGKVNIEILQGATPATLQIGPKVVTAKDVNGIDGKFTWTVDNTVGGKYATYGLKVSLASDPTVFQYSNPFHITA